VEAIAKELDYDFAIYENIRTDYKILEAAYVAYKDGYDDFLILTETNDLGRTERLIREQFDFTNIQAFSEVVEGPHATSQFHEARINAEPLREGAAAALALAPVVAPGTALLLVGALNANPPVKGTGQLIQEILDLEKNARALVQTYLPKFTSWDGRTVYVRIYMRPGELTNGLGSGTRVNLLADSDNYFGLYDAHGVGAFKVSPPLSGEPGGIWIPGDHRSGPITKINSFTNSLGIGDKIIFAPSDQVTSVQDEFKIPTVVPLTTSVPDGQRSDLIATMVALSNDYSIESMATKKPNPTTASKISNGDYFMFQMLNISLKTKGRAIETEHSVTDRMNKGSKGYFEGIWESLSPGDRAWLTDLGEGTGIGDIISVVNSVRKTTKAALGLGDKSEEQKKKNLEKQKEITEKLGFDMAEVLNDPRYKQLKSAFDLTD